MNSTRIGIDAGGTLIKIAYTQDDKIAYRKFDSRQLEASASWVNEQFPKAEVCITGGKASLLKSLLGHEAFHMIEFDATCLGIKYLLQLEKTQVDSFILTNVGTGTSIHYIDSDSHTRVGGTGVGGGTLMGLSLLLTGMEQYDQIVDKAEQGERGEIDLKVSQIYEGSESPISGDLTASNFGNVHKIQLPAIKKENLLASIIGLVGETAATTSVLAAGQYHTKHIVYIGSSFIHNRTLREVVAAYTIYKGAHPLFVQQGEFSGAVGALMSLRS